MPNETSKTKKIWTEKEWSYLNGKGIDIGCGADPISNQALPFDFQDGDANQISKYFPENTFDFVFSSHCLEHMINPYKALQEWFQILKPGGHLFILVPDEDLYEQGGFPSYFNDDHKWTFTLSKRKSWSPQSINVFDLVKSINGTIISIELQDHKYDYRLFKYKPTWLSRKWGRKYFKFERWIKNSSLLKAISYFIRFTGGSFDQTQMKDNRLAQIQFIVQKN